MLFSLNRLNAQRASLWLAVSILMLGLIAGITYTPTLTPKLTVVAASEKDKNSRKSDEKASESRRPVQGPRRLGKNSEGELTV